MFATPILLIAFNRPDTTCQVFHAIRSVKPKVLFVAIDGKRNRQDETQIELILELVQQVDWDCQVKTVIHTHNLGCGRAPAHAISWFLEHNPYGIILEDDCVPNESFFFFCQELLTKYEHDDRVMQISGTNYLTEWKSDQHDYFFSMFGGCWGWATWRRAWRYFDYQILKWKEPSIKQQIAQFWNYKPYLEYHQNIYNQTLNNSSIDWWDYQWSFARILQNGLAISPSKNLVSNIGTDPQATHTQGNVSPFTHLPTFEFDIPLRENTCMIADRDYDMSIYQQIAPPRLTLIRRLQRKYNDLKTKIFPL